MADDGLGKSAKINNHIGKRNERVSPKLWKECWTSIQEVWRKTGSNVYSLVQRQ